MKQMGRGNSAGGGKSSLGYLFGDGSSAPNLRKGGGYLSVDDSSAANLGKDATCAPSPLKDHPTNDSAVHSSEVVDGEKNPSGTCTGYDTNNYHRANGQNCGNFITNRPTTKVSAAPGGDSNLNYLFGGK